jgi:sulfite reductase alpha subunit-like flavoprotein
MQTNEDKITALRREITAQIVALMKENNLEELEFDEDKLEDPTYVLWANNDGDWYESIVKKVSLVSGSGIVLYCDDENGTAIMNLFDLACQHLDWLENIRKNIIQTLDLADAQPTLADRLKQLQGEMDTTKSEILQTMYSIVDATPEQELEGSMTYLTSDEERDKCCLIGFEARNEVLTAVLEYEFTNRPRRVPARSLNTEEVLLAMLSMLKSPRT